MRAGRRLSVRLALLAILVGTPAVGRSGGEAVEVTASRAGFRPATLTVRLGETLRLLLKTADGEHCFAVDELRVEKRILPGRTTSVELAPAAVGHLRFHCCLEGPDSVERGTLVVSE